MPSSGYTGTPDVKLKPDQIALFIMGKTCCYGYLGKSVCYEALPFVVDCKLARVDNRGVATTYSSHQWAQVKKTEYCLVHHVHIYSMTKDHGIQIIK